MTCRGGEIGGVTKRDDLAVHVRSAVRAKLAVRSGDEVQRERLTACRP
jgi:hypothetical protein